MSRKFLLSMLLVLLAFTASNASDLMDTSTMRMPQLDEMSMGKVMQNYTGTGVFVETETPGYDLQRMKHMNPDFNTYPEAHGIIWRKNVTYSPSASGGLDITHLYVILGRRGLSERWLTWNIQTPEKGSTEILDASIYDFRNLARVSNVPVEEDTTAGVKTIRFMGLPDVFVVALSWRETLPDMLNVEGLVWFQEDLRVWEAVAEIHSPLKIFHTSFPEPIKPEVDDLGTETVYTWRKINIDPLNDADEIARLPRAGIAFGTRQGNSGLQSIIREAEEIGNVPPSSESLSGFKRSDEAGTVRLIEWLMSQPEITFAEGTPRRMPSTGALTKREKILLAKSWLTQQKVNASIYWKIPFEADERTPICQAMFADPVLDVQGVKGVTVHDMNNPEVLGGMKVFALNNEGKLYSRRIPSSKSSENRLSAVMDLRLDENGIMNGTVRLIPRGAWRAFLLGNNPNDGKARDVVLSLFPGLANYKDVKYKTVKGTAEISFVIDNRPGIGGTGRGILAILPFFEPVTVRKLGIFEPPVEIKFPFIIDQNITLSFPKNATEALVSGKTAKNPDKINYSANYQNRRHRLLAEARFELNMTSVSSGNMSLLRRCLENWRVFSSKNIPVKQGKR